MRAGAHFARKCSRRNPMGPQKKPLEADADTHRPTERNQQLLGRSRIFTPEVIDDIHIKSELGRYRMTRFVIEGYREKCITKTVLGPRAKRPMALDIPVYITGMSFGALSYEAKIALARGATMAGSATCSGEGGMIPDERRYSSKWYYQCIQSRYGFNPHHLRLAAACEVLRRPELQVRPWRRLH